jgi:hypothetical protein
VFHSPFWALIRSLMHNLLCASFLGYNCCQKLCQGLENVRELISLITIFKYGLVNSLAFIDGDQVMAGLQVNNYDQGSKFWTSSQFEEPGPSHIYN